MLAYRSWSVLTLMVLLVSGISCHRGNAPGPEAVRETESRDVAVASSSDVEPALEQKPPGKESHSVRESEVPEIAAATESPAIQSQQPVIANAGEGIVTTAKEKNLIDARNDIDTQKSSQKLRTAVDATESHEQFEQDKQALLHNLRSLSKDFKSTRREKGEVVEYLEDLHGVRIHVDPNVKVRQMPDAFAMDLVIAPPSGADPFSLPHEGVGPGEGGDKYSTVDENTFQRVSDHPLSTFSIDVDTASYANARRYLMMDRMVPPPGAVRIEEFINYFTYDYAPPGNDAPFATHVEIATCPWQPKHRLMRVGLQGKQVEQEDRPASNLVFLLDVSGSMNSNDKLPLLQRAMHKLVDQLGDDDRVAIVVYAGSSGLVLPSTPGSDGAKIRESLDGLRAAGSTAGGEGIKLAYEVALANFIKEGNNRVILCTDGDFNVGVTNTAALTKLVEENAKSGVFLSVLGFGRGNLNDAMMEEISNRGNGNYSYIDSIREANKVLVEQMQGTVLTIAKDVKIQIEFNPAEVGAYRLIGYENRMLQKEDFNDDKKDAGDIGAGHTVTALYEIVPAGEKDTDDGEKPAVDPLEFQKPPELSEKAEEGQLAMLKLRYKEPDGDTSKLLTFPVLDEGQAFAKATGDYQFAASVAAFGMLLRESEHVSDFTLSAVEEIARSSLGEDKKGYRAEFVELIVQTKKLRPDQAVIEDALRPNE